MNTSKIMFKGDELGIKVIIDKDLSFEEVKSELSDKVSRVKSIFGNADTGISFIGRELSDYEYRTLLDILAKECNLDINFTVDEAYVKKYLNNNIVQNKNIGLPKIQQFQNRVDKVFSEKENNTLFHKGSLRSGASIKHNGSIVVLGDVNAGAEIIAEGNVLVIGSAKGLVQAGCTGNKKCFVFSLNLIPTQLRIGEIIAFVPDDERRKKGELRPQIAYVDEEKIFISEV